MSTQTPEGPTPRQLIGQLYQARKAKTDAYLADAGTDGKWHSVDNYNMYNQKQQEMDTIREELRKQP